MKITQKLNPLAELKYYFTPVFFHYCPLKMDVVKN